MEENETKEGCFYWVIPAYDVDSDDEWIDKLQPALFFKGKWVLLGTENEDWPVIWVGDEIKPPRI